MTCIHSLVPDPTVQLTVNNNNGPNYSGQILTQPLIFLCIGTFSNTNIQGLVADITLSRAGGEVTATNRVTISDVSNIVLSSRDFSREFQFRALSRIEDNGQFLCTVTIRHNTYTNFVSNGVGTGLITLDVRGSCE